MKYGWTVLYVDDVEKTVAFYETAFSLNRLFLHESGQYAEMETGSTRLAFTARELARKSGLDFGQLAKTSAPPPFEVDLITDDVDASFKHAVANGAVPALEPVTKPWGQRVGYVKDCNGYLIALCSAIN